LQPRGPTRLPVPPAGHCDPEIDPETGQDLSDILIRALADKKSSSVLSVTGEMLNPKQVNQKENNVGESKNMSISE
jgi:hypothetical protein